MSFPNIITKFNKAKNHHLVINETSSTATLTATDSSVIGYESGLQIDFVFPFDNVASTTLNINGLGDKALFANNQAAGAKTFLSGSCITFIYDAAGNSSAGCWRALNHDSAFASGLVYGTCSTAAATAAKTVSAANFQLKSGALIGVKFTYLVPANSTLNVNSTGAKNIYNNGNNKITAGVINAGDTAIFQYDGSQYRLLNVVPANAGVLDIAHGGTGATSASGVLTNLGFTASLTELNYTDGVTSNIQTQLNGKAASSHEHSATDITSGTLDAARIPSLDASKIASGTIDIARLPAGAIPIFKAVNNETARFALTTNDVQNGDTVYQDDTGMMYYVKDDTNLNNANGYAEYTAGAASTVPWSGVTGKPSSFTPSQHTHGNITNDGKVGTTSGLPLITGTGGAVQTGSFGNSAGTFCQGNDSRLSDSRTPKSHTHGNITNAGLLDTANAVVITDADKKISASTITSTELGYLDGVSSNIQTQLNGKAASNHGTHVSYSTDNPAANGTASAGSASTVARSDHVHPLQTSVSGNAGTATKLATSRTIDGVSFDGSSAIDHFGTCGTAAATAAKTASVTGYALTTGSWAAIKFSVTNTASNPTLNINSTGAKSIFYRGSAISAGYLAANRIYLFVYDGTNYELVGDINTDTNTKVTQTLSDTSNATYSVLLMADANADANKTNTSRFSTKIKANPSTGALSATTFSGNLNGNVTGDVTGDVSGSSGSCTGNAATATQFSANKSVTLTGDVTGSASSKAGWTIDTTLADSGVSAGTYRSVTVDAKGRVTAGSNPTSISDYGITDAKIASGTITLGSNSITPLTSGSSLNAAKLTGTASVNTTGNAATATLADDSKVSQGVYLVIPNETAQTATLTATVSGITELRAGLTLALRMPFNTPANATLNINSLGAKPIYYKVNTATANYYPANTIVLLVYETTTVETGCFKMVYAYDSNSTYTNMNLGNGYATQNNTASAAAVTATLVNYSLLTSGLVTVKFTYAVLANSTLNVNTRGAKAIYHNSAAIKANVIQAGDIATFIYDGSYYHLINIAPRLKLCTNQLVHDIPYRLDQGQTYWCKVNGVYNPSMEAESITFGISSSNNSVTFSKSSGIALNEYFSITIPSGATLGSSVTFTLSFTGATSGATASVTVS